jgi:hypothetical protein
LHRWDNDLAAIEGAEMTKQEKETGVEQALLAKLEQQVLPKTLGIQRRVDAGEKLTDSDIDFLDSVLKGLSRDKAKVENDPKWNTLYTRLIGLYNQITRKALDNEPKG